MTAPPVRLLPFQMFYCSDPEVQHFCSTVMMDFSPYTPAAERWTATRLFGEAAALFGTTRCAGLSYWEH